MIGKRVKKVGESREMLRAARRAANDEGAREKTTCEIQILSLNGFEIFLS